MVKHDAAALSPEAVVGVLLAWAGTMLLFDRLDILHSVVRYWPVAFVGAGIALLLEHFDNPARR